MVEIREDSLRYPFLKPDETTKKGKRAEIVGEGQYIDSQFKEKQQLAIEVEVEGVGTRNYTPNPSVITKLADNFGEDTSEWVGQEVLLRWVKIEDGALEGKKTIEADLI